MFVPVQFPVGRRLVPSHEAAQYPLGHVLVLRRNQQHDLQSVHDCPWGQRSVQEVEDGIIQPDARMEGKLQQIH